MYGKTPAFSFTKISKKQELLTENTNALNEKAIQRQIRLTFACENELREVCLLIYLPKNVNNKVPVFLAYIFNGNHTINLNPEIQISLSLLLISDKYPNKTREKKTHQWPIKMIINEGFRKSQPLLTGNVFYNLQFFPPFK